MRKGSGLPKSLKPLFWEYPFSQLDWERDRDLVIEHVLSAGDWNSVEWLRSRLRDEDLKQWFLKRCGRGLDPRRLRFWELILDLPHKEVSGWLRSQERMIWDQRVDR